MTPEAVRQLLASRWMPPPARGSTEAARPEKAEAEGGCGVVGLACTVPVVGHHILAPCAQMHNRGNGKGGGLAAAGLVAQQVEVDEATLRTDYLIQIALLDPTAREAVLREFIDPLLDVHAGYRIPCADDFRDIEGLDVRPPDVWRYFARVKPDVVEGFIAEHHLTALDAPSAEDEFVSQWAFRLNKAFYAGSTRRAFVLSYGRDMLVLKIVGYAEQTFRYYQMEGIQAKIWIGHQRYPTKGRIWHPGGAHPFTALDVALVHNGDFANYHAVCEYLAQRNMFPLFLTDTEVAVLLFDLWTRIYGYPLEHVIEAMAPTTERDFLKLPPTRQRLYQAIQTAHIHGSPDGPWFFITARTIRNGRGDQAASAPGAVTGWQLIGITDTSMLRPQVFALQEGAVSVGVIASEKQAIDATLASLHNDDPRVGRVADRYWNARGGSYTDGGAFVFTVTPAGTLSCTNKFGDLVTMPPGQLPYVPLIPAAPIARTGGARRSPPPALSDDLSLFAQGREGLATWSYETLVSWLDAVRREAQRGDAPRRVVLTALTQLLDRRLPTGTKKRSSVFALLQTGISTLLQDVPLFDDGHRLHRVEWAHHARMKAPPGRDHTLVVDAEGYPSEGAHSLARELVRAYEAGWRSIIAFGVRGQRFVGNGFGPETEGVHIDIYGSSGDYLGSGLDGMELHVHNDAQDQVGQILKSGKLVIHGNVGQTLLYGAKGGDIYVLGHTAGRPLINAVGRPRVVINGTALDYLAESFMAGDPLEGGGFVILNAIDFDAAGGIVDLETPYPGSNLFSLASGGAIYVRDPFKRLDDEQLNGGRFTEMTDADWTTILPHLEENERLFGVSIDRLLAIDGRARLPQDIYRKVAPVEIGVLKDRTVVSA